MKEYSYEIYYDSLQEGDWFKNLNENFINAKMSRIPQNDEDQKKAGLNNILQYDRPDIILKENENVILVLERTVEVPSGHNVGQRYGRLVAAAMERIPVIYFGPYKAYKHGADTAGPRYMNLRLFYSLKKLSDHFNTAITTINWPVDEKCEVIKNPKKDEKIKEYVELLLDYYEKHGMTGLTEYIKNSDFQKAQYIEQKEFAEKEVRSPDQYSIPPNSVQLLPLSEFERECDVVLPNNGNIHNVLLYQVGMKKIRSDPYTGTAALYYYLYCNNEIVQVLHFPNISYTTWDKFSQKSQKSKTYRMYKEFCYAILFKDKLIMQKDL